MHTTSRRPHILAWPRHLPGLLLLGLCTIANAEPIEVGTALPRYALLKPGTHHYLRYIRDGEANTPVDIWARTVSIESRGLHIQQRWDAVGKAPSTKHLDSWFEPRTMRPLSHIRRTDKDGKQLVEGFDFLPDRIIGMRDLNGNAHKDLQVLSPVSTYNFETDIEFLQTLPFALNYEANINFYHPGGATGPAVYTFKVAGVDTIAGPTGPVECWRVTTDYNRPGSVSTFWFEKHSQLFLRQESDMGNGKVLVKTLID